MKQTKRIIMTLTLLIAAVFFMNSANLPAGNVQAASTSSMKKAYKKYLTKSVSGKKYYKVVNVGDRNKPVLLIGTYKGFGKGTYTGCNERKRLGCVPGAVPAAGAVPEERHAADAVRPVHYRTAALYSVPAVRRQHCRRTYRDSDRLPVSGSAGTPAYLRRSGEMERQALDGYCTSQLAAAP